MRLRSAVAALGAVVVAGATQRFLPSGPLIMGYAADTECKLTSCVSAELSNIWRATACYCYNFLVVNSEPCAPLQATPKSSLLHRQA